MGTTSPPHLLERKPDTTYYNASPFMIDVNFTDGQPHQIAVYLWDTDYGSRVETISLLDANSNALLDARSASNFVVTPEYRP